MNRILVSTGAFKNVYSPMELGKIIGEILNDIFKRNKKISIDIIPVADGGEHSDELLLKLLDAQKIKVANIQNPRGVKSGASYLALGESEAFIGSSQILGLSTENDSYSNPLRLTTYGLGQLLKHTLNSGFKNIILGLGGSSTVDGGVGLAQALGVVFLDKRGNKLKPKVGKYFCGIDLKDIYSINLSNLPRAYAGKKITILCDTEIDATEMGGPTMAKIGAASTREKKQIFQKLQNGILHYSDVVDYCLKEMKQKSLYTKRHIKYGKSFGNAGGVLLSLALIFRLRRILGAEYFIDRLELKESLKNCDLVITGEGKLDATSLKGKAPVAICRLAKRYKIPAVYVCGTVETNLKKFFKGYVSDSPTPRLKRNGISALISCHSYFDKIKLPKNFGHRMDLFRKKTPELLEHALREYFVKEEL